MNKMTDLKIKTNSQSLQKSDKNQTLPDEQSAQLRQTYAALDWVGMEGISLPVQMSFSDQALTIPVKVDALVNLVSGQQRGIHMSRLYLLVQEKLSESALSLKTLVEIVKAFLESQNGASSHSLLRFKFEAPLFRTSLKSLNQSWKTYPCEILLLNRAGTVKAFLKVSVDYSSTCPASASLARQLIQTNFSENFKTELTEENILRWLGSQEGINATPHAQRSTAEVQVEWSLDSDLNPSFLIDLIEGALKTPVQAAVKREDEQEFARLNGQNLMFCEDAARNTRQALEAEPRVLDYTATFTHFESLHPHNAVSRISKGLFLKNFI